MRLLREYISAVLLTEARMGPDDLPDDVVVVILHEMPDIVDVFFGRAHDPKIQSNSPKGGVGIARGAWRPSADGPCGDAWMVYTSGADSGWGPLLYDVAMEYATLNGGGLIADRASVSPEARDLWRYYISEDEEGNLMRPDVTSHQLDDLENTLTYPQESGKDPIWTDNCSQKVATYTTSGEFNIPKNVDWVESPLSKRYTKEPTTMTALRSIGKLREI